MDPLSKTGALPLRLMLAFSPAECEKRFIDHYVAFYFRYAQASLLLGLMLILGDYVVDYVAHPAVRANILRIEACVPLLLLALGYSVLPEARRRWQIVMAGYIVVVAFCLFWILLLIDMQGGTGLRTWVGILNFVIIELYCFVILGVQFRYSLGSGLLILVAFETTMCWRAGLSGGEVAYWSYHVVTMFILAAAIGWWREYMLRKEFAARTSLDEARESAERLARMKGDFLAMMSHEIRTPMNGVLGMTEILLGCALDEPQRRHAQTIRNSAEALLAILNDILDFSKLDAGRVELDPIEMDVRELAEDALQLFAIPAQQKGLELACRIDPDLPTLVRADSVRLRQILLNLLGNAVKFTPSGEVTLTVERAEAAGPSECLLRFTVRDSGIGISEEARTRLFQPFSQADVSTTRRYGGTGLGLAVAKQLVELTGGEIGVDSELGRGSSFWFTTRVHVLGTGRRSTPSVLPDIRVLVVDDNAIQRSVLQQQIRALGGDCDVAVDGPSALEAMRAARSCGRPYRVALIDMEMPHMSGLELMHAVRSDPSLHGTALVLLTSLAHAAASSRSGAARADMILSKPVRTAELGTSLTGLVGEAIDAGSSTDLVREDSIDCNGARVLLAEDNPVNQEIACILLQGAGCRVTVATDGRLALDYWRAHPFDLILMDCRMPELDGFEATRQIRAEEAGTGTHMPIVALTANAMEGDRRACLAAGMDDYLSKPFRRGDLMVILRRWLQPVEHDPAVTVESSVGRQVRGPQPTAASRTDERTIEGAILPTFDQAALLKSLPPDTRVGSSAARSLIALYLRHAPALIDGIEQGAAACDNQAVARAAHPLGSSSALVGACVVSAIASELEALAHSERADLLAHHAVRLRSAYEAFCQEPAIRALLVPEPVSATAT